MTHKGFHIEFIVAVLDYFYGLDDGARMWFPQPTFDVYLRMGPRAFHGAGYRALTIADITVHEHERGKGVFGNVLIDVECCAKIMRLGAVFIENVRPELVQPLARRGYDVGERGAGMQFDLLKRV